MKQPLRILVVHGDGSRVARFRLPRSVVYGVLALVAAVPAAGVVISREHVALRQRLDDQRELVGAFQARVATVRGEITAWKVLHAKMWAAFDPEAASDQGDPDIGGTDELSPASGDDDELDAWGELALLATSVADEGPRLRELEGVIQRQGKIMSALPLRWPVRGPVNSEFGRRLSPWNGKPEHHDGIDIGTSPGTPVKSPGAGTVIAASSEGDFGRHVTLDHRNGVRSLYGHLKKFDVKVGQRVEKGQVIGLVGSTGQSTGPHLHYEVLVKGRPVNPRGFLWER